MWDKWQRENGCPFGAEEKQRHYRTSIKHLETDRRSLLFCRSEYCAGPSAGPSPLE